MQYVASPVKYSSTVTTFCAYISTWCFQERFSSKYTPRILWQNSLLSGTFSMCNGDIFDVSFLFFVELNKEYFILKIFKESLLALNQVATFLSSLFILSKRFSLFELAVNKLQSSANIIGVSLLDSWKGHLYIRGTKLVQE